MGQGAQGQSRQENSNLIQCSACAHFEHFYNALGHNSQHALGRCRSTPWDANEGQWAMFSHPCKAFAGKEEEVRTEVGCQRTEDG